MFFFFFLKNSKNIDQSIITTWIWLLTLENDTHFRSYNFVSITIQPYVYLNIYKHTD
jgi:hypothetical protein